MNTQATETKEVVESSLMEEVITSPETSTTEVPEAPFTPVELKELSHFEMIKKDLPLFMSMPFIDLYDLLSNSKKSLEDLKSAKASIDQIGDLSQDAATKDVLQSDEANRRDIATKMDDFYKDYYPLVAESNRTICMLQHLVSLCTKEKETKEFIMQSMVESCTKRYDGLLARYTAAHKDPALMESFIGANPEHANTNLILKRIDAVRSAYAHPYDFQVLWTKLAYPKNILKIWLEFRKKSPQKALQYIDSILGSFTKDKCMKKFMETFGNIAFGNQNERTDQETVLVVFTAYWLAHVYEQEYQSGKSACIKILVMNTYDTEIDSGSVVSIITSTFAANLLMLITWVCEHDTNANACASEYSSLYDYFYQLYQTNVAKVLEDSPKPVLPLGTSVCAVMDFNNQDIDLDLITEAILDEYDEQYLTNGPDGDEEDGDESSEEVTAIEDEDSIKPTVVDDANALTETPRIQN